MAKLTPQTIHDRNLQWFEGLPTQERADTLHHWKGIHEALVRVENRVPKPEGPKEAARA